ncbi:MAG TPA: hypothetical protein VMC48_00810, partial [Methanobacterium sp.]|nr:hypothetical protein [Methanobacterium sp.]
QYSWHWIYANKTDNGTFTNDHNDTWTVEYLSYGKVYTKVYWVRKGLIWEEIHSEASFNWKYENYWICYTDKGDEIFTIYPELNNMI